MTDEQKKDYFKSSIDDDEREDIAQANFEYGKEEGYAKGKAEALRETAARLLAMGLTVKHVAQGTGLSEKDIIKLR